MAAEIKRLGDAELEIMQAVWGPEKRSILPTFRPHWPESAIGPRGRWAPPSTVCVKRAFWPVKSGAGNNFYTPLVRQSDYRQREGRTLLEKLYGNSVTGLVASLVEGQAVSEQDLRELREMLEHWGGTP